MSVAPAHDDESVQIAVLALVLALHPAQSTMDELIREIGAASEDFAARDAVERAVRDLVGVGLLHRSGDFVLPTRAAVRFRLLESG